MQAMAGRGEGITEKNWKEVQDCLAPGKNLQQKMVKKLILAKLHLFPLLVEYFGKSCGLAVEHLAHVWKVVGLIPVQC